MIRVLIKNYGVIEGRWRDDGGEGMGRRADLKGSGCKLVMRRLVVVVVVLLLLRLLLMGIMGHMMWHLMVLSNFIACG
jgi:hypothetical protein